MNETGNATQPTKLCFVIGPIGEPTGEKRHADWLLDGIIKPTFQQSFPDYRVQRADEIMQQGNISTQVINRLFEADLVIADMSLQNANAFYELAIRHMKRLPTIHMIRDGEEIPFDVFPYRAVHFNYTDPKDLAAAKASLRSAVEEIIKEGFVVENPITHARGQLELQHATPAMKVLAEEVEAVKVRLNAVENETKRSATFFGRTFTSPARPRVNRKLRIVFDLAQEDQLYREMPTFLPNDTIVEREAQDTLLLSFQASDAELDSIIAALKRFRGILEVDRA
jgi:hypothetical protein